jgi:hypothetical protein
LFFLEKRTTKFFLEKRTTKSLEKRTTKSLEKRTTKSLEKRTTKSLEKRTTKKTKHTTGWGAGQPAGFPASREPAYLHYDLQYIYQIIRYFLNILKTIYLLPT